MKNFPYEFESRKEVLFYPQKPDHFLGNILEIGPGRGDWLLAQAQQYPNKKFVAVEIGKYRFNKITERLTSKSIENVLLIKGDARFVVPQFFTEQSFEKIFVLFPDPWPKNKHAFRRLLNTEFITLISHQLKSQGHFNFATDHLPYARWVREHALPIQDLTLMDKSDEAAFPDYEPTFFEKKWRAEGKKITYLTFVKK